MQSPSHDISLLKGNRPNPLTFSTPKDSQLQVVIDKIRETRHLALFDVTKSTEKDIGKFGLKTAEDVNAFLKTPMAKTEISKYAQQLNISKELLKETLFDMLMRQLLKMFLLGAMRHAKNSKSHKQQELNQAYQHVIDEQKDKQHKKLVTLNNNPQSHIQNLAQYDGEVNLLSQLLDDIQLEQHQFERQILDLNDAIIEIEERYASHHRSLETVATLFENPATTTEDLEQYLEAIGVQIENFTRGIGALHTTPDAVDIGAQQQPILEQQNLMMQHHAIRCHLNVLKGTHQYQDEQGNTVHPHQGFRTAAFVVPNGEQIHRHNNELMLVPRNKVPDDLTDEEKHQGKQRLKPMQTVKAVLQNNQTNELRLVMGSLQNILTTMQNKQAEQEVSEKKLKDKADDRKAFVNSFKPLLAEGLNIFDDGFTSTEKMLNELLKIPQSPFKMAPQPQPKLRVEDERLLNSPVRVPVNHEHYAKLVAALPAGQKGELNKLIEQINRLNNVPKPLPQNAPNAPTPFNMKPY